MSNQLEPKDDKSIHIRPSEPDITKGLMSTVPPPKPLSPPPPPPKQNK